MSDHVITIGYYNGMAETKFSETDHLQLSERIFLDPPENKKFLLLTTTPLIYRSNRAALGEKKILDLEEELRVVGQNLQQLEVSEEKALKREENYQNQIHTLVANLKTAENRLNCYFSVVTLPILT